MPLDEQVRHTAEALATDLGRELQQRLGQFVDTVLNEAAAERDALTAQAAQFASDADARLEAAVAQARAEASSEAAAEVTAAQAEATAALTAARETTAAEMASIIAAAREESDARIAEAVAGAREAAAAELAAAVQRAREEAASEAAADTAAAVQRAREEAASEATAAVARARSEVAEASAQLQADLDARQSEVERAALDRQRDERDAMLAEMERLVESFRKLDATASLSALLDALAEAAAQEAPRSALLLVRGHEWHGWSFSGFADAPVAARSVVVPISAARDLARVIDTRASVEVHAAAFSSAAALGFLAPATADVGVAVPVTVGGIVAAVLYADDGAEEDRAAPASWPETLELLARHAARCIEAQTAIRASRLATAPASASPAAGRHVADTQGEETARRYARLVVADIRLNHEPAVRLGREQRDLGERLRDQIERARDTYLQRIPAGLATRERLFEEELVQTLADGDVSLLGHSRAVVVS